MSFINKILRRDITGIRKQPQSAEQEQIKRLTEQLLKLYKKTVK